MRLSIRNRLFAAVSMLIIFFVGFSWWMNSAYLEKYYINQNREDLLEAAATIDSAYSGNVAELYLQLSRLELQSGLNILILDQGMEIKYYSAAAGNMMPAGGRNRFRQADHLVPLIAASQSALLSGQKVVAMSQDPNLDSGLLNVISRLNNGDYLLLSKSLVSLGQNAAIANHFFMITGLVTILLGCLIIYLFSRRFTEPILRLNIIAQNMANLDFSEKYVAVHNDEIGQLGQSINSLSDQLGKSISELQNANVKLQQEVEHERRIDEMRKQFISNVSHELKTPIALIQGYAEGLRDSVVQDEEGKAYYCEVIVDEADRMNKLVRELLDLSQIESSNLPLNKEIFDLSELVRHMTAKYDLIFRKGNFHIVDDNQEDLWAYADPSRVEQVLANYLSNAIDHVDERGQIRISLEAQDGKIRISVFNSGSPIFLEDQEKIFTSFYKADKARTRAYGGAGLGLSIVRAILEQHKNLYGTRNVPDGVEFWFELDRAVIA